MTSFGPWSRCQANEALPAPPTPCGLASPASRAAAEREAIAEAYRKAYQARPQETELGEAGAELFAQIEEEGSQRR